MPRRRLSIGRMMVVTAIVALDCGLVRLFLATGEGLAGLGAIGLAVSAALIGVLVGAKGSRVRRFSAGFLIAISGLVFALIGAVAVSGPAGDTLFLSYINGLLQRMPAWVQGAMRPTPTPDSSWKGLNLYAILFIEVAISVPLLATAFLGGLAALLLRRCALASPDPTLAPGLYVR